MFNHVKTSVHSARGTPEVSLDTTGFTLATGHPTAFTQWSDSEAVERVYYPEMEEVARATLVQHGLSPLKVACVNHIVRDETGEGFECDSSNSFWQLMERRGLSSDDFAEPSQSGCRLMVLNLWRSRSTVPLKTAPLAMCDRRTVTTNDLTPVRLPGYNGEAIDPPHEISLGHASDRHKWWYYPDLEPDEIICLKTFDSVRPFIPTLHSAFDDPTTPTGYRQRESVEARVVCCIAPQSPVAKL